jgi:hypothetical protein
MLLSWIDMRPTFARRPAPGHRLGCGSVWLTSSWLAFTLTLGALGALACGGGATASPLDSSSGPPAASDPPPSASGGSSGPAAESTGSSAAGSGSDSASAPADGASAAAGNAAAGNAAAGNADASGPSGAVPTPPTLPPTLASGDVQGQYFVPVAPELLAYATFDVPTIRIRQHNREIEIAYTLPALLVGGDQELSFRGPDSADANGVYQLSGDSGQARCQWLETAFSCDEALSGIAIDRDKLEREYAQLPAAESDARWSIANQFSDDPIGKLTFPR